MKRLLLFVLVTCWVSSGTAKPLPADDILAYVRTKLPNRPLTLEGRLKVRTKKGFNKTSLPVKMKLNWGAAAPSAAYTIGTETLTIDWNRAQPIYRFSPTPHQPTDDIHGTGMTWADLSFSVLWWPGSQLVKEEKKINRECYVVDVPVPDSSHTMRLWIEKKMGMLLEAQTLDAKQKQLRRMRIKSIKKMAGMWVAKDLEIQDKQTGNTTTLRISNLEWKEQQPTAVAFDPADAINQLTFDLYNNLPAADGNLVLSPYSISEALAMTYGGARGQTAQQMNDVLHFGGQGATHPAFSHLRKKLNRIQEKGQVQLSIANSLWPQVDYAFLPDYLGMTKEFYGSRIEAVDYKRETEPARQHINNWVEAQTKDRIKNLIPEGAVDSLTRLVLANAIYFKGNWAAQFKKDATRNAPFKKADGTTVKVPMMRQSGEFKLADSTDFKALELPYEGDDLSMLILLPNDPKTCPLITPEAVASLQLRSTEVMVQLPKFKMASSLSPADTLAAMGMPLAFSGRADFSGMDGSKELFISAVLHKAFIEVNEAGTEAAAATGVVMKRTSIPPQFIADRPFLFLIRETSTGTILFIGRVMDPSA